MSEHEVAACACWVLAVLHLAGMHMAVVTRREGLAVVFLFLNLASVYVGLILWTTRLTS